MEIDVHSSPGPYGIRSATLCNTSSDDMLVIFITGVKLVNTVKIFPKSCAHVFSWRRLDKYPAEVNFSIQDFSMNRKT